MKKNNQPIKFESDDTEGSDLSYESSFDEQEKEVKDPKEEATKNIQLFKEQMARFFLTHPELNEQIKFEKQNFEQEDLMNEKKQALNNMNSNTNNTLIRPSTANLTQESKKEQKPYKNQMWEVISNNLMKEAKRSSSMPSIESFTQRLNLFRRKVDKPDIITMILQNQDTLLMQIKKEEEAKARQQNKIHQTIEAKLKKETGDVAYYSLRKQFEFESRMRKEEKKAKEEILNKKEQEKNQQQNQQQDGKQKKKFLHFKAFSYYDRMGIDQKGTQKEEATISPAIEIEYKTQKGEEFYKLIKTKDSDEKIKRFVIEYLIDHRNKMEKELQSKPSILSQGQKYYSEESKEFSLLAPNFQLKAQLAQQGKIDDSFFEKRNNLEQGNVYLLTKVNKILNGNLLKKWKQIQDSKF